MTGVLDRFFEHYYRARPVNATFTGIHEYDRLLPDWSIVGLREHNAEMHRLEAELRAVSANENGSHFATTSMEELDARLAADFLAIQLAENRSTHGVAHNPSLWTGEAIIGVAGIMLRDFAPIEQRFASAAARLQAIPEFLVDARASLTSPIPAPWIEKAVRECQGGDILFSRGIDRWIASARGRLDTTRLRAAATEARIAVIEFAQWLDERERAPHSAMACGAELYDLLLSRGHYCTRPRADLLADARAIFARERATLHEMASAAAGSFAAAQELIAADHPAPEEYMAAFARIRNESQDAGRDAVPWPEWPLRYVPYPPWIEEAAPYLYLLHYRSPAPFDPYDSHDYLVSRLPEVDAERHLRIWNHSVIKLNHVVHHGAIGHHVQNWYAYHRGRSRVGQVAAVDCANRIGMFCGGTVAEGWACYVTRLMDELGYLTPLEQVSEQHTRVRFMARSIVDIEIHQGSLTVDDGIRFYREEVGMGEDAARGEAVRNSMYPCAATMYWLGTQGILDLREERRQELGDGWSLKAFHDDFLQFGSIPVPLIARLMRDPSQHATSRS